MKFVTQLKAIDPKTGELRTWRGRAVYADSMEKAQAFVDEQAGYLEIVGYYENGELVHVEKAVAA